MKPEEMINRNSFSHTSQITLRGRKLMFIKNDDQQIEDSSLENNIYQSDES